MTTYTTYPNLSSYNFSNNPLATTFVYGNVVTNGFESPVILLTVFVLAFMAQSSEPVKQRAFMAAGWLTFIIGGLMVGVGILNIYWYFAIMVLVAILIWLLSTINT